MIVRDLTDEARRLTLLRFGRTIQLYAPLYLSNECIDICKYCGFSLENKITRKTLSVEEVLSEANYLTSQGFKHLLLVSGEHPRLVSPGYLKEIATKLKPRLASLSIEVAPFREEEYRELISAGVDGVVIYQETYNQKRYEEVHLAGPKKNYSRRLEAPEAAARAGMRRIGMGILVGLSEWKDDLEALIQHVRCMKKKFWQTEFTVSLPRLRPCAGNYEISSPVSDEQFLKMICALRIALPDVGILLSTRESPQLRDRLIGVGVTQMSAGSRTEPGGYLKPEESEGQFEIEDMRTPAEVAAAIMAHGYEPVWKDWENIL
ncbi:MAG: 2-iminoacetate synthase ThiH [Deltaproteobacteria bacterium]|nr:2-iminoacetate synthase ThiH [Deltaproteobacteria bacterium]MBI2501240.1 2-iminoacetate synthase ThiH [Deltaproteobacteria bacterium]